MNTPAWMRVIERRREQAAEDLLYAASGPDPPAARRGPESSGLYNNIPARAGMTIFKESLIYSGVPCGARRRRPKIDAQAMTPDIDFEARW